MDKQERQQKFLEEHPELVEKLMWDSGKNKKKKVLRNPDILNLYKEGKSNRELGKIFEMSYQRVTQIVKEMSGEAYLVIKELSKKRREKALASIPKPPTVCRRCEKEFEPIRQETYCSKECRNRVVVDYPDWIKARGIHKANFTDEEWRVVNRIRTNSYYRRHREEMNRRARVRYKADPSRQNLYGKRALERKKYGRALTELPNPINVKAVKP